MSEENNLGNILTPQEHKLIGSSVPGDYSNKPYEPIAVLDKRLSVEECNKLRKQTKVLSIIVRNYCVRGAFGLATLEELDIDKSSDTYGHTLRDPILISSDNLGSEPTKRDFPFKRDGPVVRLEDAS